MKSFRVHTGRVAPLDRVNVDTDQIIPKQFLKRIERTGFGHFLFYDWRFAADGKKNSDFVLDQPRYKGASILLAGRNFGCGSSREGAVWSLQELGIRAIVGSSFGDAQVNIADMVISREKDASGKAKALMLIKTDGAPKEDLLTKLRGQPNIVKVKSASLPGRAK